ncbi:MAG: hypothetical protein MI974_27810 [Chitinophagales bacterium]|nr:hypothetical protein [Chitinophagales bacterium]
MHQLQAGVWITNKIIETCASVGADSRVFLIKKKEKKIFFIPDIGDFLNAIVISP